MAEKKIYSDVEIDGSLSTKQIEILGEYSFPSSDGTAGQIVATDGLGNLSFVDPGTLLILTPSSILDGTGLSWTQVSPGVLQGTVSLAPFTTSNLAEGTRLYFTNERVDDRVAALVQNGTGLTWSYNDALNTLTGAVSISPFSTTDLAEGTNLYFTNERVDDRVAVLLKSGLTGTGPSSITWTYNDSLNSLTPTVSLAPFTTSNLAEGTNLYFTNERVDDRVATLIQNSATVTWSYNDLLNTLTATAVSTPLEIQENGAVIGARGKVDFIDSGFITFSVTDDIINSKIQVQANLEPIYLDDLADVFMGSPAAAPDDVLTFDGSIWGPGPGPVVILGNGVGSTLRRSNSNDAGGAYSTVSGGYLNAAPGDYSTLGGGAAHVSCGIYSTVSGGYLNVTSGDYSTIGGGSSNIASCTSAVVAGGFQNSATNQWSTVSGGYCNTASGYGSIVGGACNTASGPSSTIGGGALNSASCYISTIGGGAYNTSSGNCSTVGGGIYNTSSCQSTTVAGGWTNTASCDYSTVGGGRFNVACGAYSAILGGCCNTVSHCYSAAFGKSITSIADCTYHVNNFAIMDQPTLDPTNIGVLVRGSNGLINQRYFGGIYSQTANSGTVTATTTETTIIGSGVGTLSVPANGFAVGDSFVAKLNGIVSNVNGETIQIRVKETGTGVILADSGAIALSAATTKNWALEIMFTVRAIGTAGAAVIMTHGNYRYTQNTGLDLEGFGFSTLNNTTFNTTVLNTLNITVQWGSNNAGNSIYSDTFVLIKDY